MSEEFVARIVIVDAHPMIREGLRVSLNRHPLCDVVAEAGDTTSALFACANHEHSVILVSEAVVQGEPADVLGEFAEAFPGSRIVVCHLSDDPAIVRRFWKAGVTGFLSADAESDQYRAAVLSVHNGGTFLSPAVAAAVMERSGTRNATENDLGLTTREVEVLHLLANGYCNKEIANKCDLSVRTVETHRLNIRRKTNSNTLSDLVRVAKTIGLSTMNGGISFGGEQSAETTNN